jgi:hypothetical protein
MEKNVQEEVKAAMDAVEVETNPSTQPEDATSSEVKETPEEKISVEEVKIPSSEKDVSQLREQVDNLNKALKSERTSSRQEVANLTKKLEESVAVLDKFKNVFVEPKKEEPEESSYATPDDVDRLVNEKLQAIKEEQQQTEKVQAYKKEIKELETIWDGKDGKPMYVDEDVLSWQKENERLYLSPREAFQQMKHSELLDYEVKQRLSGVKSVTEVEKPSSSPSDRITPEKTPASEVNTKEAIIKAMEDAEKEM